jgi:subfamily B ATP-binding cassette protein MsbA
MRRISSNTQSVTADFSSLLSQTFQGMRHVKAYGNEDAEEQRVRVRPSRSINCRSKAYRLSGAYRPDHGNSQQHRHPAVFMYGGWQADQGIELRRRAGAFITAFLFAYDPMKRMAKVNAQFQAGLAAAERVFTLLDVEPTIIDRPGARSLERDGLYRRHRRCHVFRYADGTQALNHVTIRVPHGKTVAIVGPSGAGKSTIINLIPRFYDVQEGASRSAASTCAT